MHLLRELLNHFIINQIKISESFDRLIMPAKFHIDGYQDFSRSVIPRYLRKNFVIYDIGGGKNPCITSDLKAVLNCYIVGLDIDENELRAAPNGIYNKIICADIMKHEGNSNGDLVVSLALLEHVENVEAALRGMAGCLRDGGNLCLFLPSKNALFARINKRLPERTKRLILFSLFPNTKEKQGFPAYYDRCTPRDIKRIVQSLGFEIIEERYYYISTYFSFFFPLHLLWRFYFIIFYLIAGEQAAETFGMVLRKAH